MSPRSRVRIPLGEDSGFESPSGWAFLFTLPLIAIVKRTRYVSKLAECWRRAVVLFCGWLVHLQTKFEQLKTF